MASGISTPIVLAQSLGSPASRGVASNCDLDGDGFGDVLVGAPSSMPASVQVHRGSATGLSAAPSMILTDPAPPNSSFGSSVE
jgi:hypothetical protein